MDAATINVWDYLREYEELREEILTVVDEVFKSGRLVLGANVANFEQAVAKTLGVSGGVGVNSATDALHIALRAANIQQGDEIITVSNTAVPTISAIVTAGATPVFVDISADDYLMDVSQVEAAVTSKTKAILPVHLYGQCVDMDPLNAIAEQHGLFVLEDCAQAQGAFYKSRPAGSLGQAAAFSFYPTKVLGGYGDGGMITSDDDDYLDLARSLRMYGMQGVYYSERHGYNSRLDEVQAAILALKLPRLADWINRRREIAARYNVALSAAGLKVPFERRDNRHSYYVYVVEHPERDDLLRKLRKRGINCNVSYPYPIHTMHAYEHLGYRDGQFPVTEQKARVIFSLPMYPHLKDEEVETVIASLLELI